jgi:hypothetical protein
MMDKDSTVRHKAALALKSRGGETKLIIPILIEALKDKDDGIRFRAALDLWKIGEEAKAAVPALIEALKDKDKDAFFVRRFAALALGSTGGENRVVVPALIAALKDKDKDVRSHAALGLASIGKEAKVAIPSLIEALKDNDASVRYSAAAALGNMGGETKGMISLLIEPLKDDGNYIPYLSVKAADAIKVIGENYENKSATMPIADLDQVISDLEKALPALKGTQGKTLKLDSQIASINRSIEHLKKTRESRLLDRTLEWLAKNPLAIGGLICIIFFPFLWFKLSQLRRKPTT